MGADNLVIFGLLGVLFYLNDVFGQGGPPSGDVTFGVFFMSSIYRCPDEKSEKFINPSEVEAYMKDAETSMLSGHMELLGELGPDTMLEIVLRKDTNGKFETVMTHELCKVCNEFGNEAGDYYKFLQFFGLPDSCPIPPGKYPIHDMVVNTSDLPVNSANTGCYVANLDFYETPDENCKDGKEFLGCLKLEFCIEPL